MGPYMRPIPVGASAAMLFSLVVAFVVTPWAAVRLLNGARRDHDEPRGSPDARSIAASWRPLIDGRRRALAVPRRRRGAAARRDGARAARARHGEDAAVRQQERAPGHRATCRRTRRSRRRRARPRRSPTRRCATQAVDERAELHRHLVALHLQRPGAALLPAPRAEPRRPAGDARRPRTSAASRATTIAKRMRDAARCRSPPRSARAIQVVEVPPGPPVLQTLVAEVYGPDAERRLALARDGPRRRSSRPPAWSTWTGTSNRRSPSGGSTSTREKAARRRAVERRGRDRRGPHGRRRARRRACCTTPPRARTCPIVLRLPRAQRGSLDARPGAPARAGARSPSAS